MAKLTIPSRHKAGIAKLRGLDEKAVRDLRESLDKVSATVNPSEASLQLMTLDSDKAIPGLKEIRSLLVSLYAIKSTHEIPLDEFVNDVCDAIDESSDSAIAFATDDERRKFKEVLATLLDAEPFAMATKAYDLQTEGERTFCDARILTDLRPVFGKDIASGPAGMVIIHRLKLGYHNSEGEHRTFYIALDAEDLVTLKKAIDRAELKARSLKSIVKDVPFLGIS